jgi:hypothetical protein
MTAPRGSVRRHVRIAAPPEKVWSVIGDPAKIQDWFPGIVSSAVDGTSRVITTGSGIPMPEHIVTNDPIQRRFQYRITAPMFREHLSTLDVLDLGDGTSVVIAGAAGNALEHLRDRLEAEVEA